MELDAFTRLALEAERTLFVFYGYRTPDGEPGGPYFKQAHSLSEALLDLEANEGVATETYFVRDAFLELDEEEGPTLHVELISLEQIAEGLNTG